MQSVCNKSGDGQSCVNTSPTFSLHRSWSRVTQFKPTPCGIVQSRSLVESSPVAVRSPAGEGLPGQNQKFGYILYFNMIRYYLSFTIISLFPVVSRAAHKCSPCGTNKALSDLITKNTEQIWNCVVKIQFPRICPLSFYHYIQSSYTVVTKFSNSYCTVCSLSTFILWPSVVLSRGKLLPAS